MHLSPCLLKTVVNNGNKLTIRNIKVKYNNFFYTENDVSYPPLYRKLYP